ncbi:tRNA (adenine(58)-N(1))-methyltransferase non-catalytic subunit TRM6 isoform X1 [Cryptotermes secundus]|nr:tRNA (adenine(58)-N(1))-methyltransferase non-catalytic subunit TRM6 isoform X1 [Cryptotermes secundus]
MIARVTTRMTNKMEENYVKVGDYIIIQRQNYTKLHKVTLKGTVMLGKDQLELGTIIGRPVWKTYKMEPKKNGKRVFVLKECDKYESLAEQLKKDVSSGSDNRNIFDDGRSQLLSTEEIIGLRTSGLSGQAIVGQLIENSKTFRDKTEYSQEKYLKKKEKKYFEYITVRWPTIRLISEVMYRTDPVKIMGLRMDTLSQILTIVGMHSHGMYMLYESGCQGLVASAMLNNISIGGRLLHIHPGNLPQKQAIYAMNYSSDKMSCLISVNIYSFLRKLLQENSVQNENGVQVPKKEAVVNEGFVSESENDGGVIKTEDFSSDVMHRKESVISETNSLNDKLVQDSSREDNEIVEEKEIALDVVNEKKRKHSDTDENMSKKPRWEQETEKAADFLRLSKADGLVIVAREHPANILTALLPYIAPSRPFIVYCPCREPLLELYVQLKGKNSTVGLRVTETWLRSHQVLPSRTHPDILMSGGGGYLLSGIVVEGGTSTQELSLS